MTRVTKPVYNHLAVVFDFDDTLAPDTLDRLLESCGVDPDAFERERVRPLVDDGWDEILAKFHCLIEESKRRGAGDRITRERLVAFGRGLAPFEGVQEMFERLRRAARECDPEIELEYYLLSSGFAEIARHTSIAHEFTAIWGCDFHYDQEGEIAFPRQVITHTEKERYLALISRGIGGGNQGRQPPEVVVEHAAAQDLHLPFAQMIYVGDGASDVPCFNLLNEQGGTAIGVAKPHQAEVWGRESISSEDERVASVVPVDYHENSELMRSLVLAVESVGKRIALSRPGAGNTRRAG